MKVIIPVKTICKLFTSVEGRTNPVDGMSLIIVPGQNVITYTAVSIASYNSECVPIVKDIPIELQDKPIVLNFALPQVRNAIQALANRLMREVRFAVFDTSTKILTIGKSNLKLAQSVSISDTPEFDASEGLYKRVPLEFDSNSSSYMSLETFKAMCEFVCSSCKNSKKDLAVLLFNDKCLAVGEVTLPGASLVWITNEYLKLKQASKKEKGLLIQTTVAHLKEVLSALDCMSGGVGEVRFSKYKGRKGDDLNFFIEVLYDSGQATVELRTMVDTTGESAYQWIDTQLPTYTAQATVELSQMETQQFAHALKVNMLDKSEYEGFMRLIVSEEGKLIRCSSISKQAEVDEEFSISSVKGKVAGFYTFDLIYPIVRRLCEVEGGCILRVYETNKILSIEGTYRNLSTLFVIAPMSPIDDDEMEKCFVSHTSTPNVDIGKGNVKLDDN